MILECCCMANSFKYQCDNLAEIYILKLFLCIELWAWGEMTLPKTYLFPHSCASHFFKIPTGDRLYCED